MNTPTVAMRSHLVEEGLNVNANGMNPIIVADVEEEVVGVEVEDMVETTGKTAETSASGTVASRMNLVEHNVPVTSTEPVKLVTIALVLLVPVTEDREEDTTNRLPRPLQL